MSDQGKTVVQKQPGASGRPFGWRNVLAAIQDEETRSAVVARFRSLGFTPDDFVRRAARVAMVEVLVSAEDRLENEHPRRLAERIALRDARRALEAEVWP